MNHPAYPTVIWICHACKVRREVEYQHVGVGSPACPNCMMPMLPEHPVMPELPQAIASLQESINDPDTVMEPE
jgi:hypothetical protein